MGRFLRPDKAATSEEKARPGHSGSKASHASQILNHEERLVPFVLLPSTHPHEWHAEHERSPWLNLFGDLVVVAVLTVFSAGVLGFQRAR
jgi:hypothetical protein